MRFAEAVAFQFVNPKAWIMGLTAASVFVPDFEPRYLAIAAMCGVFSVVNLPCIATWAALGASLKRWPRDMIGKSWRCSRTTASQARRDATNDWGSMR